MPTATELRSLTTRQVDMFSGSYFTKRYFTDDYFADSNAGVVGSDAVHIAGMVFNPGTMMGRC